MTGLYKQFSGAVVGYRDLGYFEMPSSVIAKIAYDKDTATLLITYVSGDSYAYKDVPERVYKHLKAAPSKGNYLNYHIKGKYEFEKL